MGAFLAPSIVHNPPVNSTVIVAGEVLRASGLGEGARIMYQALQKHHIPSFLLNVTPYSFSIANYKSAYKILSNNPNAPLILHVNAPQIPYALLNLPRTLLKNRKIIGYWAWELEVLPKEWEVGFRLVHEIWVPSQFVANAVRPLAGKYNKTIRIIPHPIADRKIYSWQTISKKHLNLPENKLIILVSFNLSSSFARKNPLAAISAFRQTCGNKQDVCLVLKITYSESYPDDMNKILHAIQGCNNIIINKKTLSPLQNQALFHYSDIILSLHRSEGFGLVPAEGMLAGKPVIATNWSATAEFIDESCGIPINYTMIPVTDVRDVYQLQQAYWADANCDIAAHAIDKLRKNSEHRIALGSIACKKANEQFNSQSLLKGLSAIGAIANVA